MELLCRYKDKLLKYSVKLVYMLNLCQNKIEIRRETVVHVTPREMFSYAICA